MSKYRTESIVSNLSGKSCEYLVIDQLPTNFRSYEQKSVKVRGLNYEECISLAKYVGYLPNPKISQLASIYEDVIHNISVYDLEYTDFLILMVISSIYTSEKYEWIPNVRCNHLHDGKKCTGMIVAPIVLDDFEFKDPAVLANNIPITIDGTEVLVGTITVRDVIEKETYHDENPDIDDVILSYACLIKNSDMTFDDKVKLIRFSNNRDLKPLKLIDSDLSIMIDPIPKDCPVCGTTSMIDLKLNTIRGYL